MSGQSRRPTAFDWTVLGGAALLNLLIAGMLTMFLQQSYRQHEEHADVTARNLATALKENISATVREIDVALAMTAADAAPALGSAPELLERHLAWARLHLPVLGTLRIVDGQGRLLAGPPFAPPLPEPGAVVWLRTLTNGHDGLALGRPVYDHTSGRWLVRFARALHGGGTSGPLQAALVADIDHALLTRAFALVDVGPNGAMTLTSSDEIVYARYANRGLRSELIGQRLPSVALRGYAESGRQPATYFFHSPVDGHERLISLQRIFDPALLSQPDNLFFSVGLARSDYLHKWYEELRLGAAVMLLSLLLSGGGAWLLLRFWRERLVNQERLRGFEREHAVNDERLRIMQDLHDGVGSQLLSALMIVESGKATQQETAMLLQQCMDDMRLAIDALSPDEPDLLPVLGNFRYRMEQRFRSVGLALHWRNHDLPDTLLVAPHEGLQVLRIAQEALANVLRHAHARQVQVDLYFSSTRLRLRVADDGVGYRADSVRAGRGLTNMRQRAGKLGATFDIAALEPGTAVELDMPLRKV